MAKFDVEGFKKEAKQLGLDEKEIQQIISEETSGVHPDEPKIENPAGKYDYLAPAGIGLGAVSALKLAKFGYDQYNDIKHEGAPKTKAELLQERIEPLLDVNQQKPAGPIEPTLLPEGPVTPKTPPVANAPVSPPSAPVTLPNAQAPTPLALSSTPEQMASFATGVVPPAPAMGQATAPTPPAIPPAPPMQPPAPPMQAPATVQPNPVEGGGSPTGQNQSGTNTSASGGGESNAFPEATNASTNATKESGNLTNPAENPSQGGVEQIKTPETSEKENKPTSRIRITKEDEERIKAIKEAGIAPTHQLTREEIAKQPMHSEMKKIVEQGNATIEANPELKSEIERLKAGHKIPEGFVWIPHMGSGDVHFINTHGFEKYRQFKNEELGGKPIGEYALNPKEKNYNPDLREKIKKFSERSYPASNIAGMPEMTGEQKGKAAPEETNFFGKLGKLKPVAKTIAGVGGVMMALSELAQAKQEARHGNPNAAIGRMAKVATGFAPLATFTNDTNSNEQEAMNRIRNQQSPVKGAVIPK